MKLEQIAELVTDKWNPGDSKEYYIGLEHIEGGIGKLSGVGSTEDIQSNKTHFKKDDILFGKLRPYFRKVVHVNFSGVCSTDIWVVRAKEGVDQKFLYYLMYSQEFVDLSMKASSGTRMPRANWKFLSQTEWHLPPLSKQKEIAHMLSVFDEKIEVLRKENQALEELAQIIYKRWFVDFNFPDEQGNPYREKGGEMVESELGVIPKGWRVGKLGEFAEVTMGQSPKGVSYNEAGEGVIFFQGRAEFTERFPQIRLYTTQPNRIAKENSVLMSVRAPVGDINVASEDCCIGRGLASVYHKDYNSFVLYFMQKKKDHFEIYNQQGTVFGSIKKDDLNNIELALPEIESPLIEFDANVHTLDEKYFYNSRQIHTLSESKERLMAKLI